MLNYTITSPLTILSFYGKLRRSGAPRDDSLNKLRGLIHQLSPADRKEFTKGVDDWEAKQGKKMTTGTAAAVTDDAPADAKSNSRYIFGMSEYDRLAGERGSSAIRPLHGFVVCPTCGKKTDINQETCMSCGNLVDETVAEANLSDTAGQTFFGPSSKLILAINGATELLELPMQNVLTLGRHVADSTSADVDLTDHRAEMLGVSRKHASIKRQGTTLTLTDLGSTNHTYLNGQQLADNEARTLKSGDEVALGTLGFTVIYRDPSQAKSNTA